MRTPEEFKEDPIRRYLNPEMTEKAPKGFTEKVMAGVNIEARPMKGISMQSHKSYVPVISIAVILVLTALALTLPSAGNVPASMPWMKIFHNIELPALKINLDSLLRIKLPGYLPWLLLSILFLSIFDRALNGIFHREKKAKNF
jgi:hypothetical protein